MELVKYEPGKIHYNALFIMSVFSGVLSGQPTQPSVLNLEELVTCKSAPPTTPVIILLDPSALLFSSLSHHQLLPGLLQASPDSWNYNWVQFNGSLIIFLIPSQA